MRAIGNVLTASDPMIVERCLWLGVLDKLTNLLYQSNSNIIKECLWSFSNITAGPSSHIEKFIESDSMDRVLFLTESRNIDIRKEAMYVICHAITGADVIIRAKIYEKTNGTIFGVMIKASYINEVRLLFHVIEAIEELLKLDDWYNTFKSE